MVFLKWVSLGAPVVLQSTHSLFCFAFRVIVALVIAFRKSCKHCKLIAIVYSGKITERNYCPNANGRTFNWLAITMDNCRLLRIKDTVLFVLFVLRINWHGICLCNSLWRKLQSAVDNNYHLTLYICNCIIIVAATEQPRHFKSVSIILLDLITPRLRNSAYAMR